MLPKCVHIKFKCTTLIKQIYRVDGVNFERLSTGLRINSAADDAAGLSVGTRMQSQFLGIQRSVQNATDWVSLFQTA